MDEWSVAARRDAAAAFRAAVAAVRPETLIPAAVAASAGGAVVCGRPLPSTRGRRLVVALGKAAPALAAAWLDVLPGWATELYVLTPYGVPVPERVAMQATVRYGAHPIPDAHGEAATLELLGRVRGLAADDLMVVLLSGGSSALLAAPKQGLVLADVRATTRVLLESGAPITAVNTVRRELLEVGGGGLARAASPARVVSMVLSDVLGDSLPDIACGPTVPSPTTAADALAALDHYRLMARVPRGVVELLGRRAAEPRVASREPSMRNRTEILGNNATAVRVAADALDAAGYAVSVIEPPLVGEASVRGRHLGSLARAMAPHRPTAVVVGGETTVTVRGAGHGGRNQELVLAAALELPLDAPAVVFSAGTDGIDGASENAGGVVDSGSADRMRDVGVDPVEALAENDSARALAASVDVIVTGPTGTNVCDLTMVLVGRRR